MANNKTHHSLGDRLRVYKKRFSKLSKAAKLQIAAIVGNEVIMLSDVNAYIAMMVQQNPKTNANDPELKKKIINAM